MKRTSALCLAAALTLGLAGCSGSGRDMNSGTGSDGRTYGGTYNSGAYNSGGTGYDYGTGTGYGYNNSYNNTGTYSGDGSLMDDAGNAIRNGVNDARNALSDAAHR